MRHLIGGLALLALIGCGEGADEAEAPKGEAVETVVPSPYMPPSKAALDTPDFKLVWAEGCRWLDLVPPPLADGSPGKYSLPFLTIYNGEGDAVLHDDGFVMSLGGAEGEGPASHRVWTDALGAAEPVEGATTLAEVAAHAQPVSGEAFTPEARGADVTFVRYAADWCAPCKGQSADIKAFRAAHPELDIVHVEVEADMQKWTGGEGTLDCEG